MALPTPKPPPSQLTRIELREILLEGLSWQTEDLVKKVLDRIEFDEQRFGARLDAVDAALARIEQLLTGTAPTAPTSLQYLLVGEQPMIVASAALTAGGTLDQINVVDQNGVVVAPDTISWSPPAGQALPTDLTFVRSDDGMGFNFIASAGAITEAVTLFATWTDPAGIAPPVVGGQFTFNITGVGPAGPASLQYDEVVGS